MYISIKKTFYRTITFVKNQKEILYKKNEINNYLKIHKTKPQTKKTKIEIKNKYKLE